MVIAGDGSPPDPRTPSPAGARNNTISPTAGNGTLLFLGQVERMSAAGNATNSFPLTLLLVLPEAPAPPPGAPAAANGRVSLALRPWQEGGGCGGKIRPSSAHFSQLCPNPVGAPYFTYVRFLPASPNSVNRSCRQCLTRLTCSATTHHPRGIDDWTTRALVSHCKRWGGARAFLPEGYLFSVYGPSNLTNASNATGGGGGPASTDTG